MWSKMLGEKQQPWTKNKKTEEKRQTRKQLAWQSKGVECLSYLEQKLWCCRLCWN
jgi:hypothetical protein